MLSAEELKNLGIVANSPLSKSDFEKAGEILDKIHKKTLDGINQGKGPFYAEIYFGEELVASGQNSVVQDNCSVCHAEINAIKEVHQKFNDWALSDKNLTIYINAEPCLMCLGAIMWSGIKRVFFSVPSIEVEEITGFDEGFKPDWLNEFKKRGIEVFGGIKADSGKRVLENYVKTGNKIYKPR